MYPHKDTNQLTGSDPDWNRNCAEIGACDKHRDI